MDLPEVVGVDCTEEERALIARAHRLLAEMPKAFQLVLLEGWGTLGVVCLSEPSPGVLSVSFTPLGLLALREHIDQMELMHEELGGGPVADALPVVNGSEVEVESLLVLPGDSRFVH